MKTFTKNDAGFICAHCGKEVPPLGYSSRNHCPHCLWSLHVDINPGDRAASCGGAMEPVAAQPDAKKDFIVWHRCTVCGAKRPCRCASDDDRALLVKLTAKGV